MRWDVSHQDTHHMEISKLKSPNLSKNQVFNMTSSLYDDSFYDSQMSGSYRSASLFVQHFLSIFEPYSVADLGCGRGTWLKAFGDNGVKRLVGFDGNWNSQDKMVDQRVVFTPIDLNLPFTNPVERFDLAISLEVAEHLKAESSKNFVRNITSLSDVVMFAAAYTKQGGIDHINEQPHTYWARLFMESGYLPYDLFRSTFWGNPEVEFFYQQNTFLYVKSTSGLIQCLKQAGYDPISNIEFMNCVHPRLLEAWVSISTNPSYEYLFNKLVGKILPQSIKQVLKKLKS